MKSEKEKMLHGALYDPLDQQLSEERLKTRLLLKKLNDTREDQAEERNRILKELLPGAGNVYGYSHLFIAIMDSTLKQVRRFSLILIA